MNRLYQLYCRGFQKAFHLASPLLPYRDPTVLYSISALPAALSKQKIKHVLIVTDGYLRKSGLLSPLTQALFCGGIGYAIYDRTVPNPTVRNVEEARDTYIREGCSAIIGFGGGSAIDCAKAVGARIARPLTPISDMAGILRVAKKFPFLVAIPTTAGTGSEVTVTTVISDPKRGRKFPISDFPLIPDLAVLDPRNTKTLPPHLTATTGMDALTHAVEAYIGRSTVKQSREDALEASELIFRNLEKTYSDGNDTEARANMMQAAFLAGRAFSRSYVGYAHAIAHALGGKYGTPHGLANAVLLPIVLEEYGESAFKKLKELAVYVGIADSNDTEKTAAKKFITEIREMNRRMNISNTISGIKIEDIPELAQHAAKEANPLYPVPKLMDAYALERLILIVGGFIEQNT